MGQFEKIVVLTVLFLITVILVVSLSGRPDEEVLAREHDSVGGLVESPSAVVAEPPLAGGAHGIAAPAEGNPSRGGKERSGDLPLSFEPLTEALDGSAGEGDVPSANHAQGAVVEADALAAGSSTSEAERAPRSGGEDLLLETAISDPARDAAIPGGSLLRTLDGLEPSPVSELMFHLVQPGETWSGLAQRYYGDAGRVDLLRQANEDRELLVAGEEIFVPVFDRSTASRGEPRATLPADRGGERRYVVQEGDSLWRIAKQHYGKGSRFMEIFEANRDVLKDVDALLVPGTRLRIP